ncbi:excinuclease ABC subunit UvrA [Deinococcus humi]|uniref:UvrABC system protein A n=1 Tax=Deinococcus humi TaxID=662880 RepID=A0A7W8K0E6_9DEIO|nr:excinuclease ABC subunit UvrA [Deinococcus humi]MBB5365298.1 excinuclease ABC subunit A [Deinococcus humi]GGO35945.1 UvrABC system protein A [Deinococcus humi]
MPTSPTFSGFVQVRGAREHNLKNLSVQLPRDALVVFTGVSGSGKSSLAFGTLYAEAQRRYLESVSPYARRLFHQVGAPDVDAIDGLPPAVALQQQRGTPTARSSVGSVTTLSNLVRMLYSRAGTYPPGQDIVYAEGFSPNTPEGACPNCHGLGRVYEVTEASMVPDPSLTIRERAVAAWPQAWGGQNQRDILVSLGIDVDVPWRELPQETRDWILFSEEQPVVPVYPGLSPEETKRAVRRKLDPDYMGTFSSARRHVLHTFATTESAAMKRRVQAYMISAECPACHGKRLRPEALAVTFAGHDITEFSRLPLKQVAALLRPYVSGQEKGHTQLVERQPEQALAQQHLSGDLVARLNVLLDLGLGYLQLERSTPSLSPGELQRLRLATQLYSNLFGVVYVLDEPSAGLHPADTEALLKALGGLKAAGNSLFVVEHDLDVVRHADWLVDVGPGAGEQGGQILYSGPPEGLRQVQDSSTAEYLFRTVSPETHPPRTPSGWLKLEGVTRHNLKDLSVRFPLGALTCVTGVSGSGKSTLVSQVLAETLAVHYGQPNVLQTTDFLDDEDPSDTPAATTVARLGGDVASLSRLVQVDQRPIGRTPRSNMATYTGLFDHVRKLFAATPLARENGFGPGRFSFNVRGGRCEHCQGEGWVMVELLFLPSVYAPCPVCHGARYNAETLKVQYRGRNVAEVLGMTVDDAWDFFRDDAAVFRSLDTLREVGLGYLRLGQPATELSGGEAQRIKLATELQRAGRGRTLYILDEPTTGLHPADVERLARQLDRLVDAGHTVIAVEHDMQLVVGSDWVIDVGPGAGDEGGQIVAQGTPLEVAQAGGSRTAPYLARALDTAEGAAVRH